MVTMAGTTATIMGPLPPVEVVSLAHSWNGWTGICLAQVGDILVAVVGFFLSCNEARMSYVDTNKRSGEIISHDDC